MRDGSAGYTQPVSILPGGSHTFDLRSYYRYIRHDTYCWCIINYEQTGSVLGDDNNIVETGGFIYRPGAPAPAYCEVRIPGPEPFIRFLYVGDDQFGQEASGPDPDASVLAEPEVYGIDRTETPRVVLPSGREFVSGKTLMWQTDGNDIFMISFGADGTGVLGDRRPGDRGSGGGLHNIFSHPGSNFRWTTSANGIDIEFVDGAFSEQEGEDLFREVSPLKFVLGVVGGRYQLEVNHVSGLDRTYSISSEVLSSG
ncbi:MAG TPA: hypothetical protein VE732_08505 [Nitrososphaera sp.]|nr:hypothetical protein [Nitrososphaera sp.]